MVFLLILTLIPSQGSLLGDSTFDIVLSGGNENEIIVGYFPIKLDGQPLQPLGTQEVTDDLHG